MRASPGTVQQCLTDPSSICGSELEGSECGIRYGPTRVPRHARKFHTPRSNAVVARARASGRRPPRATARRATAVRAGGLGRGEPQKGGAGEQTAAQLCGFGCTSLRRTELPLRWCPSSLEHKAVRSTGGWDRDLALSTRTWSSRMRPRCVWQRRAQWLNDNE